jgi:hypothetical protein
MRTTQRLLPSGYAPPGSSSDRRLLTLSVLFFVVLAAAAATSTPFWVPLVASAGSVAACISLYMAWKRGRPRLVKFLNKGEKKSFGDQLIGELRDGLDGQRLVIEALTNRLALSEEHGRQCEENNTRLQRDLEHVRELVTSKAAIEVLTQTVIDGFSEMRELVGSRK